MKVSGTCASRWLSFSSDAIAGRVIERAGRLLLEGQAIVVNTGMGSVSVHAWERERLPAMSSTTLQDVALDACENLLLFKVATVTEPGNLVRSLNWTRFHHGGAPIDLWRSSQDKIGSTVLNLDALRATSEIASNAGTREALYDIFVNLWFAPAGTNCLIHRAHPFIEIHTQILGIGHMQKFQFEDPLSLYEDIALAPGATTERPFCLVGEQNAPSYPWHQYFAETDCIWLAIEYHQNTECNEYAQNR